MATPDFTEIRRRLADRYTLERELGRGGMGTVYLARDLKLDRQVALKVLPLEFAEDAALHARFLRETRTAASFSHPNIVPVHSVEEREGVLAYAMGLIEGESVRERVERSGPLSVREIVRLLQDIGYALAYAHGRGVVHRDIKPDNIMIERATGRALLMDFGISRSMTGVGAPRAGLTQVGEVVGTPEYMSPEQASGDVVDGRSDLYSLGLVAWFATTGRVAMSGETTQKILVKQLTEAVPPVESVRPDLPDLLSAAIDRCIEKAPEHRFQTAELLVEAVENSQLAGPEIPLPVRSFLGELETLSLVLFFLAFIGWLIFRGIAQQWSGLDALLPVVILFGVGVTRILQVRAEARRLVQAGFTPEAVLSGMRAVHAERDQVREARRADPQTVVARRRTLRTAAMSTVLSFGLVATALSTRVRISQTQHSTPAHGLVMLFSGLALFGVSAALVARSPFRASVVERLLRRVWLGPIGSALVRRAGDGISRSQPALLTPIATPARVTGPTASPPATSLEQRVQALEAWRRSVDR